jgi:hypothetical protein
MVRSEKGGLPEADLDPYLYTLREVSDAGMQLAVPAALYYCSQNGISPPKWLTNRASDLLNALLHLEGDRTRRRRREPVLTYMKDQVHYARYDAVQSAKEARVTLSENRQEMEGRKGKKADRIVRDLDFNLNRVRSDESIFEEVKNQLKKTAAAGGADAVKKSYQRISKEVREQGMVFKYHSFDDRFLRRIGAYQKF